MLVDGERHIKCQPERHEYKNIQPDRTLMSPGPAPEVALVRRMYEWFARDKLSAAGIATCRHWQGDEVRGKRSLRRSGDAKMIMFGFVS
ncbi:hypothetical protein R54767_03971 [Paraburkholderia gardini]|uniref:Uncharacterized protein n=1 Tax=Paraburkholderia gardini TaxID=2823469 RepID=A0ABM8U7S0_9BURK|nr:hypothetical protein R54767_03971 [Paraburkholderia gardini]